MTAPEPVPGPDSCGCPETDGKTYHQRGTCTDPAVAALDWYADGHPKAAATPGQAEADREVLRSAFAGQPDEIPDAFARYQLATFPADLGDFARHETAMRWKHLTGPAEREFWRSLDAAQGARPAPDLSAGLADLESELRDVTRQVALCRSTKIPCVFCEQEITRAMGAVQRWAQDVAEHERTREPLPAPELDALRMTLGPCPVHTGKAHAQIGGDDEMFCLRDLADTAESERAAELLDEWPDPEKPVTGRTPGGAAPELAAARAESRYREALERIFRQGSLDSCTCSVVTSIARRALEGK